jgi:hypothetical protein
MIDPRSQTVLKKEIAERMAADRALLDGLRDEIRPLRDEVRPIQPRTITSISLVGTDGGNNRLRFDPFLVQVIRVVDSSNNEYCLEAVTPTTRISLLSARQFDPGGSPRTSLGEMMAELGVSSLTQLSHMIQSNEDDRPVSPSWVQVYRELVEWAILLSIVRNKDFGTDTLIVFDGLLRTKVFRGELFKRYREAMDHAIVRAQEHHRRIYLAGVAKHSQVLTRYRLAMSLEGVLRTDYPGYVEIPRSIEEKAYIWSEYARGDDRELESGEVNKFVGGKMFFVKFGVGRRDPIWPVDIYLPQRDEAQVILGSLLADAVNGFPVPFYPQCLQRAHENAALVDFDLEILQDQVFDGIRGLLDGDAHLLDEFRLEDPDPSRGRYE